MIPDCDNPGIILTTDFGIADPYVGVMKGVIFGLNPRVTVIDLTHGISPQNVRQGAFILGVNHRYFPENAIHVAVVDPEVGTDRFAILVQTPRGRFLAPDNGILSNVVWNASDDAATLDGPNPLPTGCTAYRLTEPRFWAEPGERHLPRPRCLCPGGCPPVIGCFTTRDGGSRFPHIPLGGGPTFRTIAGNGAWRGNLPGQLRQPGDQHRRR